MTTRFDRDTRAVSVGAVTAGGAADKAGIKAGDKIVSVNGSTDFRGVAGSLASARAGEKVKVVVSQGDAPHEVELTIQPRNVYQYAVTNSPSATPEQVRLRDQWLVTK